MKEKIGKTFSCFGDNCICIGCIKFSLLRREYLSLAVNVSKNSLEVFHITKSDFSKFNLLYSDPSIW